MTKRLLTKRGFTLIELMVVIVIIGILATLGLVTYRNALIRARDSKAMGDVKDIISALEQDRAARGITATYRNLGNNATCTTGIITGTDYAVPAGNPNPYTCYNASNASVCIRVAMENTSNGNCSACSCSGTTCTITSGTTHFCAVTKQ